MNGKVLTELLNKLDTAALKTILELIERLLREQHAPSEEGGAC